MSVAELAEDITGMALLWVRGGLLFLLCALPVSPAHICSSIGSGVGPFQCTTLPCYGNTKFDSAVESHGSVLSSLVGAWGCGCSRTPRLFGPPPKVWGLSGIAEGGLGFVWPVGGGGTTDVW